MHKNFRPPLIFILFTLIAIIFASGCGGTSSSNDLSGSDSKTGNLDHGRIQGTVIASSTGNVVSGAIIETFDHQASSGEDGRYLLGPMPAGDYRIITRASGYSPRVKEKVRVYPGKISENINFTLSTSAATYDPEFAILAIMPELGTDGDRISIFCSGCGTSPGRVTFNGKEARIIDWNSQGDDKIVAEAPTEVESGEVKVIINGNESNEIQPVIFTAKPVILRAQPDIAKGSDIITLYGRNFNLITNFNKVSLAGIDCRVISVTNSTTMQVQLPQQAKTGQLSIRIESNEYQLDGYSDVIVTIEPELVYLTPRRSVPGVPLTIYGYNFGENKDQVKVIFNDHTIQPNDFLSFSDTSLSVEVPDNSVLAPDQSCEVIVQVNESKSNPLTYTAYNTVNNTLTDYGIFDFEDVSAAGTLHLATLRPDERIVFLSVLSGGADLDLDGNFAYSITGFLGGNLKQVPNLPANKREYAILPADKSVRISQGHSGPNANLRAELYEPASTTFEVYIRDFLSGDPWNHENDILATGTIQATNSVALVYNDINTSGISQQDALEIADRFKNIYDTLATACEDIVDDPFPPEGNIDDQPRIAIFVSPLLENSTDAEKTASYFDVRDKDPSAPNSAGTEILYANSETFKTSKDDFYGALAQTLSFMIYHNQKGEQGTTWQSMGLGLFARQEAGYGFNQGNTRALNHVSQYLQYPETVSLNHWPAAPSYADYGMQFLFTQYIFDRCGGYNAIRVLERKNGPEGSNSPSGLEDIQLNIIQGGLADPDTVSVKEFFHDFCLALYCDDLGLAEDFTGYDKDSHQFSNIKLRNGFSGIAGLRGLAFNESPVFNRTMSIKGFGCRLVNYPQGNWGDLEVTISSIPSAGDFKTWVIYYKEIKDE